MYIYDYTFNSSESQVPGDGRQSIFFAADFHGF